MDRDFCENRIFGHLMYNLKKFNLIICVLDYLLCTYYMLSLVANLM